MVLGNELLGFEGGATFVAGKVVGENVEAIYGIDQLPQSSRLGVKHIFIHKGPTEFVFER